MLRLTILPGMLLIASVAWVCTETATAQATSRALAEGKQFYSNRAVGYTVPTPYYGTPMAPRFIVPPMATYPAAPAYPGVNDTGVVATTVKVATPSVAPGMAHGVAPVAPQVVEKTIVVRDAQPEVNVYDELDAFHARLAKIQLEKHQLTNALVLVQKIRSETFKVRTVVDLAEYVSRDKNYQSEAEQLYRLAIAGMDALGRKQPFKIDIGGVKTLPIAPITEPPQPPKPQPVPTIADPPLPPKPLPVPIIESPAAVFPVEEPSSPAEPSGLRRPSLIIEQNVEQNGDGNGNGRVRLPAPPPPRETESPAVEVSPPIVRPGPVRLDDAEVTSKTETPQPPASTNTPPRRAPRAMPLPEEN